MSNSSIKLSPTKDSMKLTQNQHQTQYTNKTPIKTRKLNREKRRWLTKVKLGDGQGGRWFLWWWRLTVRDGEKESHGLSPAGGGEIYSLLLP